MRRSDKELEIELNCARNWTVSASNKLLKFIEAMDVLGMGKLSSDLRDIRGDLGMAMDSVNGVAIEFREGLEKPAEQMYVCPSSSKCRNLHCEHKVPHKCMQNCTQRCFETLACKEVKPAKKPAVKIYKCSKYKDCPERKGCEHAIRHYHKHNCDVQCPHIAVCEEVKKK